MDRRSFLKVLSAAGLVAVAPPVLEQIAKQAQAWDVRRETRLFDYDTSIGLCVSVTRGDNRYRHAVKLSSAKWEQMTPAEQDEMWTLVTDCAMSAAQRMSA